MAGSHRLILGRGGTTKVVDRLEAMGLVERQPTRMIAGPASCPSPTPAARRGPRRQVIDAILEVGGFLSDEEAGLVVDNMDRMAKSEP